MVITGTARPFIPRFVRQRIVNRALTLMRMNPGFHRFVLQVKPGLPVEHELLVDPSIEPELRRLFARIMVLDEHQPDPEPYVIA